jgi:hypothetical protein
MRPEEKLQKKLHLTAAGMQEARSLWREMRV